MGNGGVLFDYRHLLQWRALPNAPPALGFFPPLDQLMRNVGPSIVRGSGTVARKNLTAGVHREIGRLRRLEFTSPVALELRLLRLGEHTGAPQSAALAAVAGMFEIPGVKLPPRHRPATMRPPQAHNLIPVFLPCGLQLLATAEKGAVRGIGTQPQFLHLTQDGAAISDSSQLKIPAVRPVWISTHHRWAFDPAELDSGGKGADSASL